MQETRNNFFGSKIRGTNKITSKFTKLYCLMSSEVSKIQIYLLLLAHFAYKICWSTISLHLGRQNFLNYSISLVTFLSSSEKSGVFYFSKASSTACRNTFILASASFLFKRTLCQAYHISVWTSFSFHLNFLQN